MWHEFKTACGGHTGKEKEGCERVGHRKYNDDCRKKRRVEAEDVQYKINSRITNKWMDEYKKLDEEVKRKYRWNKTK